MMMIIVLILAIGWFLIVAWAIQENKQDMKKCRRKKITFKNHK